MATHEKVRERLESERARLTDEVAALALEERGAGGQPRGGYATHAADEATETFDQERTEALSRHLKGLLGQVEHALRKLETGSYGRCDRCGAPIASERLEALPHVTLCLSCQARSEADQ